jgi:hypothetical protein
MAADELTDEACIAILADVGNRYVGNAGLDTETTVKLLVAMAQAENRPIPGWVEGGDVPVDKIGPLARQAIEIALASDDTRLRELTDKAIEKYRGPHGQVVDLAVLAVGGGILLALAIISKVKYTKKKGWELEPGFPGLADVLDKTGGIIRAAMGGGAGPSEDGSKKKE